MPVFKDRNAKEWTVALDGPTIRAVRQERQVNLGAMDGKVFAEMEADPVLLLDVLWIICRSQAQAAGISDVQFGQALVGDAIDGATKALTDAWLDFFPTGKRSLLRSLADKQAALTAKATAQALAKVEDPDLETKLLEATEAKMTRELSELLTRLSGATNSLESSASGPTAAP